MSFFSKLFNTDKAQETVTIIPKTETKGQRACCPFIVDIRCIIPVLPEAFFHLRQGHRFHPVFPAEYFRPS